MDFLKPEEVENYKLKNIENPLRTIVNIPIKVFIGQIPKMWNEKELVKFFSNYGEIFEPQIIRSSQGIHKCCAFINFKSITEADIAILALNENYFLPGSQGKLQLRWAAGEAKKLGCDTGDLIYGNRLFITNLPKNVNNDMIEKLFIKFGSIRFIKIIKEKNPIKNRCYLAFNTKEQAITAKQQMNGNFTFPEFGRPIEVFLAESKRNIYKNKTIPYPSYIIKTDIKISKQIPNINLDTNHIQNNYISNIINENDQENNEINNENDKKFSLRITEIPNDWTQNELIDTFKDAKGIIECKIQENELGELEGLITFDNQNSLDIGYKFANGRIIKNKSLKLYKI